MATLTKDTARDMVLGNHNDIPVIAADIIYEGAAVGVVPASAHARPLAAGDVFGGFCQSKADNLFGNAGDIKVRVNEAGSIKLSVSGAVITDKGQPVYATDDDTFVFNPVGGVFVGFVRKFVSSGVVMVGFDAFLLQDPYAEYTVRETLSANKTFDAQDTGKLFWIDTDATTTTLPAIATGYAGGMVVNGGAYGAVAVNLSPAAADMILGPNITGANDKDLINTKATAKRGDRVKLDLGDADGYVVTSLVGTWAREA